MSLHKEFWMNIKYENVSRFDSDNVKVVSRESNEILRDSFYDILKDIVEMVSKLRTLKDTLKLIKVHEFKTLCLDGYVIIKLTAYYV